MPRIEGQCIWRDPECNLVTVTASYRTISRRLTRRISKLFASLPNPKKMSDIGIGSLDHAEDAFAPVNLFVCVKVSPMHPALYWSALTDLHR